MFALAVRPVLLSPVRAALALKGGVAVNATEISEDRAQGRERLALVAKSGGLPGDAEYGQLRRAISELHDLVDEWRLNAYAVAWAAENGSPEDVPFPVTHEHVSTLAVGVASTRFEIEVLTEMLDEIEGGLFDINLVREVQSAD